MARRSGHISGFDVIYLDKLYLFRRYSQRQGDPTNGYIISSSAFTSSGRLLNFTTYTNDGVFWRQPPR